jgi:hypothetical protein
MAIFSLRQGGILIGEATVPSSARMTSGRIYVELTATVRTGIAISNPNSSSATVRFYFTDSRGEDFGSGMLTVAANGQTARFLDEAPFNGPSGTTGSFSFSSDVPVAVTALRGITNERSEFLVTAVPVADLASTGTSEVILPHFASGGGWSTQIVMSNPTNSAISGDVGLFDSSGNPLAGGGAYSLPPRRPAQQRYFHSAKTASQ